MTTTNFTILEEILAIPNTKITNVKHNETEIHIYLEWHKTFGKKETKEEKPNEMEEFVRMFRVWKSVN